MPSPNNAPKQTLVEEGTEFKGTLKSHCPVVVRGHADGEISAPSITVTDSGSVTGDLKADQLRSEGTLAGSVDADDVYLSGTVRSDTVIKAKTLEVKLKPEKGKLEVTFGECVVEVGDEPSKELEAPDDEPTAANAGNGNGHAADWFAEADSDDEELEDEEPAHATADSGI